MDTLQILGGRKEKIRPGDVLGALTGDAGFAQGSRSARSTSRVPTYVAVERGIARRSGAQAL
jgi:ATP-independent RNA helicase DbpA